MCRLVAYLGRTPEEQATLSSVVLEGEHSLLVQSYAPKEMLSGVVNADGFGVGWYVPEDPEPAVYRSNQPLWADRSFASLAPRVRSGVVFAAVRSATPGLPAEESGVPPFSSGRYTFMHNGAIKDFRRTAMRHLRDSLSDDSYAGLLGTTDSETVFAALLDRLGGAPGRPEPLAEATAATVRHVATVCKSLGVYAALNVAATDGEEMAFTRYSTEGPGNSLYYLEAGEGVPGTVVASEKLDGDAGWKQLPDGHLLVVRREGVEARPLKF
jgi:gamma-glutamyl hercynylcysteine S-oxide hydrolase